MLDIPSITGIVAALGVIVGVTLAYLELRTLVKQRQTDLIMRLHSEASDRESIEAYIKFMSLEFDDYNDYVKKYGLPSKSESPANTAYLMMGTFFEGIGVLAHRKLVTTDLITDLFPISRVWTKMKPIAEGLRKQLDYPQYLEWLEYLHNEIQKREQRLQQTQQ